MLKSKCVLDFSENIMLISTGLSYLEFFENPRINKDCTKLVLVQETVFL